MRIHYECTYVYICIILYNHLEDNLYVWCICVCGDQKLIDVGCLPNYSLPYCFESGSLIDLGASECWITGSCCPAWLFVCEFRTCAYTTDTLLTEPSPLP